MCLDFVLPTYNYIENTKKCHFKTRHIRFLKVEHDAHLSSLFKKQVLYQVSQALKNKTKKIVQVMFSFG
jgi:hypothetical protein